MERGGYRIQETGTVRLDLTDAARETFVEDPESFAERLLRRKGFTVNDVRVSDPEGLANGKQCQYYHIVYPPEEKSAWEWHCVDAGGDEGFRPLGFGEKLRATIAIWFGGNGWPK